MPEQMQTWVSNNHNIQFFKIKFHRTILVPLQIMFFKLLYYHQFYTCFSYINNSNVVIRGSNPYQKKKKKKKADKEVTLHSVCEVKEFGQVTNE